MTNGKNPLMLMMALSAPGAAHAIGLGDIHVDSALNEHFAAEIDIVGATALELTDLRASVANRETFVRFGADRPAFLSSATFKVVQDSRGRPVLAVRSSETFTEPVVNFLVDLNWHNGELIRQYTVLLDPTDYVHALKTQLAVATPAATAVPASVTAAQSPSQSARKMTHIKVGAKATLRGIAWRVGERSPSDLQKMMIAIFRANPAAFDGNINRLHRGALLTIPAHAELEAISKAEAKSEFRAQMAAWRSGARVAASNPARPAPTAATTQSVVAAAAGTASVGDDPAVLDRRVKSLEQELNESNKVLQSTDAQLQSLLEQAARAEKPVVAALPLTASLPATAATPLAAALPTAAAAPNRLLKSDLSVPSIVAGIGILGVALARLYFRMRRRRTLRAQPSSVALSAAAQDHALLADADAGDSTSETVPNLTALQTHESARKPAVGPVHEQTTVRDTGDTRPDLQALLEPKPEESTQPLLPIISTGEPAGRGRIAGTSVSGAASPGPNVNMRADAGTARIDATRLDYNLLDLDMTAQHVHMPSVLNEQVVMKERRTNLADVLKTAIEREPDRHDLRLKLLELYYSAASTNQQAFLDVVQKFARERHHLPPEEWARIASMGRQIAAENPLFVDDPLADATDEDLADCA
ncbi:MAG: FimV/HubP family polar landmark protein [Gammaproteobacteria bacterium]